MSETDNPAVAGVPDQPAIEETATDPTPTVVKPTPQMDWENVQATDLPDTLVKEHPLYREVLSESIERRKTISGLREQLQGQEQAPEAPAEPAASAQAADPMAEIVKRLDALEQARVQAQQQDYLSRAIKNAGLPAEASSLLSGVAQEEVDQGIKVLSKLVAARTVDAAATNASGTRSRYGSDRQERERRALDIAIREAKGEKVEKPPLFTMD